MNEIDVVLPFHRDDELLRAAVESLKNARDVDIRIVAVNDSGKIISKSSLGLSDKDLLILNDDHGYLKATALGVASTTRSFIGFQDSDDLTDPDRFSLAIKRLKESQYKIVTGELQKFIEDNKSKSTLNLLGELPQVTNERLLWLLGTHGADSSLVGEGNLIRSTWINHSNFPPEFADFGWMMSLDTAIEIGHEARAIYFYRMHEGQFSRGQDIECGWAELFPTWKEAISNIPELKSLDGISEIDCRIALALVMPASTVNLDRNERAELNALKNKLIAHLDSTGAPDLNRWKYTLNVRVLIASRGRNLASWWVFPKFITKLAAAIISGYQIRRGNKS
jgi:hypothetical protein